MHKVAALLVLFTLSAGLAAAESDQRSGYLLSFEFNGDGVALAGATWLPRFEPAAALPHSHAWRVELIEEAGKESLWFANLPPPAGLAPGRERPAETTRRAACPLPVRRAGEDWRTTGFPCQPLRSAQRARRGCAEALRQARTWAARLHRPARPHRH